MSVSRDAADPGVAAVAASVGLTAADIVQVHQVHGREVLVCRNGDSHHLDGDCHHFSGDALVSDCPRHGVGVRVADCVPILIADQSGRVVAAVHGGWRGTAAGVVRAAVRAMREQFDVEPEELVVAIGPSIRACCYEVGPDVREAFLAAGHEGRDVSAWFSAGKRDRLQLDVPRANRDQLEALGVPAGRIFDSGLCTACNDGVFHSYRRHGAAAGRSLAVIRVQRPGLRAQAKPSQRTSDFA